MDIKAKFAAIEWPKMLETYFWMNVMWAMWQVYGNLWAMISFPRNIPGYLSSSCGGHTDSDDGHACNYYYRCGFIGIIIACLVNARVIMGLMEMTALVIAKKKTDKARMFGVIGAISAAAIAVITLVINFLTGALWTYGSLRSLIFVTSWIISRVLFKVFGFFCQWKSTTGPVPIKPSGEKSTGPYEKKFWNFECWITFIFPPFATCLMTGTLCSLETALCIPLTVILGWFPGIIFALFVSKNMCFAK